MDGELSRSDAPQWLLCCSSTGCVVLLKEFCPISRKLLREAGFSSPPQGNNHERRVQGIHHLEAAEDA